MKPRRDGLDTARGGTPYPIPPQYVARFFVSASERHLTPPANGHDTRCHSRRHRLHGAGTDQAAAAASRGRRSPRSPAARKASPHIASVHPSLTGRIDLPLEDLGPVAVAARADCVFSCLPHGASATVVPQLLAAGARVVDFSADYRLDTAAEYAEWYGLKHPDPERVGKVVYGLPELFREQNRRCPIGRQSGLLSDVGHLGPGAAVEGRADRAARHHRRFQKRRERRRPNAQADHALSRMQRKHLGLQRRPASAHARDRSDRPPRQRQRGERDFHAAFGADGSRHSHDRLFPAGRRSRAKSGCSRRSAIFTPSSRSCAS